MVTTALRVKDSTVRPPDLSAHVYELQYDFRKRIVIVTVVQIALLTQNRK